MTGQREHLPYLRLLEPGDTENVVPEMDTGSIIRVQSSIFSDASSETLGFIDAANMKATTFQSLLEDVKPRFIFDVRQVPSFSDGSLTRRTVFALFESYGIRYFDVAGALGVRSRRDATLNPRLLIPNIMSNILKTKRPLAGPILFFVDGVQMNEAFIDGVAANLPSQDGRGWEISVWEASANDVMANEARSLVFISHANPQDNDVALWFATRLAAEGFDVWSDVTRLIGGELTWDTIEDIIRGRAACVIVLLSQDGHEKPGLLDEVNAAITTERRHGLKNFVIPVRIDDLPFSAIRANLARKNVIDGADGLAQAFRSVVESLDDMGVPRRSTETAETLRGWWRSQLLPLQVHEPSQWDLLIENRIEIKEWPSVLRRFNGIPSPYVHRQGSENVALALAHGPKGTFTFATADELPLALGRTVDAYRSGEALTCSVIDGSVDSVFGCDRRDVLNALSQLVRQSWDFTCRSQGLIEFRMSNNRRCWYVPDGFVPKNEIRFVDHFGKTRRRALIGKSEARGVYWHFAIEASVFIADQVIRLKPHIIFTEDGRTPISSVAKQHALRRGFCRNWWNNRWRDLLTAMLRYLSDNDEIFTLPVSPQQSITVTARLASYGSADRKSENLRMLPEPKVGVGFRQETDDPREGLMLFGPVSFERNPREIRVGVIGAQEGLGLFEKWCAFFSKPVPKSEAMRNSRDVPFPGFEAVFGAMWPKTPTAARIISRTDLLNAIRMRDRHQAVYAAVDLFVEEIRKATVDDDAQVDIWFVVIPDEIYLYGRPDSRVPKAISLAPISKFSKRMATRFSENTPSIFPEDNAAAKIYEHHADFHHQLKARLLKLKAITQVLRESSIVQTLNPSELTSSDDDDWESHATVLEGAAARRMQDPLNVSWNIATACFFKAGGRPWKVTTARPGVCYVGLIFKKDELRTGGHACCGAQLFLDSGEGLVFKGAMGPWYSAKTGQFHLSRDEAQRLMEKALEAYKEIHNQYPSELFVHGRTRFTRPELGGFAAAASEKTKITGVRITRTNEYKLFSSGDMPVKRGTTLTLDGKTGLIWTSGFIDRLNTYQGRETPNPLRVEICGPSSSDLLTILKDILTLTKMNFNSSVYADGFPVTMRFADAIGDVLMATGDRELPPLPFRHYI